MDGGSTVAIEIGVLATVIVVASYVDLHLSGRRTGQPSFRSAVIWSIGWIALALVAGVVIAITKGTADATTYLTVYVIERSLSIDNVFVFLLLFTYFSIEPEYRARLIIWGVIAALLMRGAAILGGVELLERFDFLIYVLGVGLLILAIRVGAGIGENIHPDKNLMVRAIRRFFPVKSEGFGGKYFLREQGTLYTTPIFLCLVALIFTDLIFAIDSIPAAFAITRDAFIIWTANVFALLGLRALIIVVERLLQRFRYLDETIAVVLGVIALKLIGEEAGVFHISPGVSLGIVVGIFTIGIVASLIGDQAAGDEDDPDNRLADPDAT
jgi:tellurite resistance protein TerC